MHINVVLSSMLNLFRRLQSLFAIRFLNLVPEGDYAELRSFVVQS